LKRFVNIILIILGSVFVAIGLIGIFLPLLPTTPFLLLGASCYIKSSPKLYDLLIGNKYLGMYIKNYREGNGIPLRTKVIAISMLWVTILCTVVFMIDNLYIKGCLVLIATGVTWHIASQKTFEPADNEEMSAVYEVTESEDKSEES
jgi:uncharacterized membrane protein YbaN (DUF454 family)